MRRPARALLILTACLGATSGFALSAPHAFAHFPPPAYLVLRVDDEAVTVRVVANHDVCRDWFGLEPESLVAEEGAKPVVTPEQQRALEGRFPSLMLVRIDRIEVAPVFHDLVTNSYLDHGVEWNYVDVTMRFPALGAPRQVAFAWFRYEAAGGYGFVSVDAELEAYGKTVYPAFRETEPEIVWHKPRDVPPPPEAVLPAPAPPPTLRLPVLSLALLPLLLVAFLAARTKGVPPRERWAGVAVGLGLVLALSGVAQTELTLPGGGFEPPAPDEARYTAQTLLRNVYRAFDHDREEEVYDTLAKSVSGTLLDTIYLEVHESLVMKEQGGAVAKVENVEMLENTLLPDREEGAPWFRTRTRWRVEGKVGHWGHTHQRVNEYEADVTVALQEGAWRIADLDVRTQKRIDDGGTPR